MKKKNYRCQKPVFDERFVCHFSAPNTQIPEESSAKGSYCCKNESLCNKNELGTKFKFH